jgi:hypothetical protein
MSKRCPRQIERPSLFRPTWRGHKKAPDPLERIRERNEEKADVPLEPQVQNKGETLVGCTDSEARLIVARNGG